MMSQLPCCQYQATCYPARFNTSPWAIVTPLLYNVGIFLVSFQKVSLQGKKKDLLVIVLYSLQHFEFSSDYKLLPTCPMLPPGPELKLEPRPTPALLLMLLRLTIQKKLSNVEMMKKSPSFVGRGKSISGQIQPAGCKMPIHDLVMKVYKGKEGWQKC